MNRNGWFLNGLSNLFFSDINTFRGPGSVIFDKQLTRENRLKANSLVGAQTVTSL
jgi:hypothetical protein